MHTGKRILVVDDEAQARWHIRESAIDRALLDVNLQDENGWDLAQQLLAAHPTLPIVMITAQPDQSSHPLAAAVSAVMEKPLDLPRLLHTIASLTVQVQEKHGTLAATEGVGSPGSSSLSGSGTNRDKNENQNQRT